MITVTILVKDAERKLQEVLTSVKDFAEVILIDTGSTDRTLEIARSFPNVRIFQREFTGFGELRNYATTLATYEWILALDGDEVLSELLQEEILGLALDTSSVYALPFHNFFNKKHIRTAGWYPEDHVRLYSREKCAFSEAKVHEKVEKGCLKEMRLRNPVFHYPYETIDDFLIKMQRYSHLFAIQNVGKKHSSPLVALYHGIGGFLKSYFLKRGILGGYEGLLISLYNGHTAFYKYLKLYHLNIASKEKC